MKNATKKTEETKGTSESDWLPQMTIKNLGCDPKEAVRTKGKVFMARIYGEATALKTKESRSGDNYSYLIGQFAAYNSDGKPFTSEKLFLPGTIMEAIESSLIAADGHAVQFGYDVYAVYNEKTPIGYNYAAKIVLKTETADRLAALESAMVDNPLPVKAKTK